jgi:hypothetical protein
VRYPRSTGSIFALAKAFSVKTMRAKRLVCARVSARVGLGFIE